MSKAPQRGFVLCLTYYLPNISGLTLSAHEVAREMVVRGHSVAVVCGRFPASLPARERRDGMEIYRVRPVGRLGKALLMPAYAAALWRAMDERAFVNVHLPNMDAATIALVAAIRGRRLIVSYISSMSTDGVGAQLMRAAASLSHMVAGLLAERIVVPAPDYAAQSTFCRLFRHKVMAAPLPIHLPLLPGETPRPAGPRVATADSPWRVGYIGRIARQKSLDVLLDAVPHLVERVGSHVTIDLVGPSDTVIGEADWREILAQAEQSGGRVRYLGTKYGQALAEAYRSFDVLVLPSADRLESFGLVQVEALIRGVPCVTSNRPGMRYPIEASGMGLLVPPGDPEALAKAIGDVLLHGPPHRASAAEIETLFGTQTACRPYTELTDPDEAKDAT